MWAEAPAPRNGVHLSLRIRLRRIAQSRSSMPTFTHPPMAQGIRQFSAAYHRGRGLTIRRTLMILRARSAGLAFDLARGDGADELCVVAVILVGVAAGELADGVGEPPALSDVAGDGHGVTGAGVGAGERAAAGGG